MRILHKKPWENAVSYVNHIKDNKGIMLQIAKYFLLRINALAILFGSTHTVTFLVH